MKTPDRVLDVDSNLRGERVDMSIESGSMGHIMGILTELYSDSEKAVIRELATNARDSDIEAGYPGPVEVTLPTDASPNLTIRDHGTGLDADDIRNIYSRYGASTKRESDDAVGMLGLGCKSPLAYTDQFTLSGVKDGVCTVVSVARTDDGGGEMTIVHQYETDEPSGVTVIVPCKRVNHFREKAADLFKFWDEGTVVVDGQAPKRIDGFWIADDLLLTTEATENTVVMGGVPYPMAEKHVQEEWSYRSHMRYGWKTVAFVPIGAVNFVPSREQLMFNAKTRETLAKLNHRFEAEREPAFTRQLEQAETADAAIRVALLAEAIGFKGALMWRGEKIPTWYEFGRPGVLKVEPEKKSGRRDNDRYDKLRYGDFAEALFFVNYDGLDWSPSRRAKLELWLERTGTDRPEKGFICIAGEIPADLKQWLGDSPVVDWRTGPPLEKVVRERTPRSAKDGGNGNNAGVYTVRDLAKGTAYGLTHQEDIDASQIDRNRPLLYTFKNVESWGVIKEHREAPDKIAKHVDPDAQIVILGLNRAAKFQREYPRAENLEKYNARVTKEWLDGLTAEDRTYLAMATSVGVSAFAGLEQDKVDDPELKEAIRIAGLDKRDLMEQYHVFHAIPANAKFTDPRTKYPLFPAGKVNGELSRKHLYLYVNAVHNDRKEA